MLLQRLSEYADRMQLPPTLYSEAAVRYIVELDSTGRLLGGEPIDTSDPSNPRTKRGSRRLVPQVQRSSGVKPLLLADNAEYTLGLGKEKSKPDRTAACHRAYMELVDRCARDTGEAAVSAVKSFLANGSRSQLHIPDDFDPAATVTFRVDGVFPIDLPSVQAFWATINDPGAADGGPVRVMQCIVCGRERPVLDRLQGKIKGVPGGQIAGTSIISANAPAFESYGLEASLVAPTCAECGERFTKAANHLLSSESNRLYLGGVVFLMWTREEVGFSLLDYLTDPQPEQVRDLIASLKSGHHTSGMDETAFYATALTGSGGRVVVRDWIDTTVGAVRSRVATWFQRQEVVGGFGELSQPIGLFPLAMATAREARDLAAPVPRALLRAALSGTPLPFGLLYQAVRRNRAEQKVTRPRAALIKLVLLSHEGGENREGYMVQLDLDNPNPAYRCGRLLAVLEEIQRLAVPGAKATIVDRFFGTASSAPSSVFGRLLRGAQPHLGKLERDRPSAWRALQSRLEDIQAGLEGFPRVLTLEDQGRFALGYYHQRAWDRMKAKEGSERRKAAGSADAVAVGLETTEF